MKSFKLKMKDANGKNSREIGLEEPSKHRPKVTNNSYRNGTLITIQGACENGLEEESNEDIMKYFSEYGVVVKEAWFSTYKGSKQLSGNRSLVLELTPGLSIPRTVFYVGPHAEIKRKAESILQRSTISLFQMRHYT